MFKRIPFILLTTALFLAACSIRDPGAREDALEAMMPNEIGAKVALEAEVLKGIITESISYDFIDVDTESQTELQIDGERIVIKNANISIAVDNPAKSMDAIAKMTEEMGGFVVASNLFFRQLENGLEVPQANITIRVPAERLTEALDQIQSGAGRLLSKNESGQDVTREYTDLQSRLRNFQEAEAQLREILVSATKTEDVLNVFNQLINVREQIEVIQGQIQYFEQSAAFSLISVDLFADEAVQPLSIGGWQPVGVAKNAIQTLIITLKGIANVAIWLALYVLPIVVVLFYPFSLIWRGINRWRTRRKRDTSAPVDDN